jgi:hypothetical protein
MERHDRNPPSDDLIRAVAKGEVGIEALEAAPPLLAEFDINGDERAAAEPFGGVKLVQFPRTI